MKVFVDLRNSGLGEDRTFAFYCTVVECFEEFNGAHTWYCRLDFVVDFDSDGGRGTREAEKQRLLRLIPDWVIGS